MPQFKHLSLLIYIIPYYDIFYINILFQVTQLIIRDGMEINIPFMLGWFSLKKKKIHSQKIQDLSHTKKIIAWLVIGVFQNKLVVM